MFKLLDIDYVITTIIEETAADIGPAIAEDLNTSIEEVAQLSTIKGFFKALFQ